MSRFRIILFFVVAIAFVVGLFVLQFIFSFHSAKITIPKDVSVKIYKVIDNRNDAPFKTISSSTVQPLQNGNYCLKPEDPIYNPEPFCFAMEGKDISITFNPSYSNDYLTQLLVPDQKEINELILKKYSPLISGFTLKGDSLYGHGDWYAATLTQKVARSSQGDIYRILLKKVDKKWTIVAYPQIVLTKYDYPQVPYDILDKVNRLSGIQGISLPSTSNNETSSEPGHE